MHFSKTFTQLLQSLPPEFRNNAVQYRQLKKIINQIVTELSSHGLQPALLHKLIDSHDGTTPHRVMSDELRSDSGGSHDSTDDSDIDLIKSLQPKVVYELNSTSGKIEPQLRIWISVPSGLVPVLQKSVSDLESLGRDDASEDTNDELVDLSGHLKLLWSFRQLQFDEDGQRNLQLFNPSEDKGISPNETRSLISDLYNTPSTSMQKIQEVVIPLVYDSEFYNMLSTTLESISAHLKKIHSEFSVTLQDLSRSIANSSHPASVAAGFQPLSSVTTHAGAVRVRTRELKSDLYFWREIFQLYVEAEVFESMGEASRGQWPVEESERRLQLFAQRATQQGFGDHRKFKSKQSLEALGTFLNLNLFILNIKKFSYANSEATRKIIKKHTKRTALFYPGFQIGPSTDSTQTSLALIPAAPFAFPRILVQAMGETLLPIIPSVEDYSCLICTSIAFKPIRLSCGHLFCVRCLVKMQKRRKGDCPMCRSPSVLVANRTNVDWALLNFMQDWFPIESKEKLKNNEREAAEEELRELGLDPNQSCTIV